MIETALPTTNFAENAVVNKITATLTVASPSRKSRKGLPAFLMPKTQKEVFFKCFDYTHNFMTS